jgi:hypothetical protein
MTSLANEVRALKKRRTAKEKASGEALRRNLVEAPQHPDAMNLDEQRTSAQMDAFDIPRAFRGHAAMPQGIPPDVKKWGQLKQWVGTNGSLGQDILELIKAL